MNNLYLTEARQWPGLRRHRVPGYYRGLMTWPTAAAAVTGLDDQTPLHQQQQ